MSDDPRYPIGRFEAPERISPAQLDRWIDDIERHPEQLRAAVAALSREQLEVPYREGGWNARQVVHHLADSHLNSFVRFKWTLTEERPTIKAYFEERWAELPDAEHAPLETSLALLDALHARWVVLLRHLTPAELAREFVHPDSGPVRLDLNVGIYAWHGAHHVAHISSLAEREGWV